MKTNKPKKAWVEDIPEEDDTDISIDLPEIPQLKEKTKLKKFKLGDKDSPTKFKKRKNNFR